MNNRRDFLKSFLLTSAMALTKCGDIENFVPKYNPQICTPKNLRSNKKKRRIIMNNDGNDCHLYNQFNFRSVDPTKFLNYRTSGILDSQIDSYFYCTGIFNLYQHRSNVSEFWQGIRNTCPIQLVNQGTDTLEVVSTFCKENNKEIFWSMRMNDTHDSHDHRLLSRWKLSNLDLLLCPTPKSFPYGDSRWSALNYEKQEVHSKVLEIIEDVISRYELDGIELDFFRHPIFFYEQLIGKPVEDHQRESMNDLMKRIHGLLKRYTNKNGNSLLLAVRIPDSLAFSHAIGLDVSHWLCNSWIDILIGGGYFQLEPWKNLVTIGKDYDVQVYSCLSASRLGYTHENWRFHAADALSAGVDGVYTFNLFDSQHTLFDEIGSLETLESTQMLNIQNGDHETLRRWLKNGAAYLNF